MEEGNFKELKGLKKLGDFKSVKLVNMLTKSVDYIPEEKVAEENNVPNKKGLKIEVVGKLKKLLDKGRNNV